MKKSKIHSILVDSGAKTTLRDGSEIIRVVSDIETEYNHIRKNVGLAVLSHIQIFKFTDEDAIYFLDEVLPANVANIRYGRVLHTFLSDNSGKILSDVYVVNNDEEIYVLFENCTEPENITDILMKSNTDNLPITDLSDEYAVFSLDGPQSWRVIKELFPADVLGMPYLSVESHALNTRPVTLIRAGKTGEFGYLIIVSKDDAVEVWSQITEKLHAVDGDVCGMDVYDLLKLDGRFFNVNREGRNIGDPLILGLQWMIDFEKENFVGRSAILDRRAAGLKQKIIGGKTLDPSHALQPGDAIFDGDDKIAEIVTADFSFAMNQWISLAVFDISYAYAGLNFQVHTDAGPVPYQTISMPPFIPESLTIKLDEM